MPGSEEIAVSVCIGTDGMLKYRNGWNLVVVSRQCQDHRMGRAVHTKSLNVCMWDTLSIAMVKTTRYVMEFWITFLKLMRRIELGGRT